jgi:hypothetical protein
VLLASTTLTREGTEHPSFRAFEHIFWIATVAALTAAVLASFLPQQRPTSTENLGRIDRGIRETAPAT